MSEHDVTTASPEQNAHHFQGWLGKHEEQNRDTAKGSVITIIVVAVAFVVTLVLSERHTPGETVAMAMGVGAFFGVITHAVANILVNGRR